ncbi:MAG: Glycosyl transferase, WecB/TagA/CpsF family [Candidatus Pacebacteria bacterium GW2011_GWA1_46_10]|nr:MAG: Glycosyl transferase, WecB/TagA/CpsF family [Candidatus Pacebacteria bacterium GW2011_GWA1_46_10]HCR81593.1 glycosyltransferase [Candidatus Paceibacterota bacterium]
MKKSDQTVLLFKTPIFSRPKSQLLKWLQHSVYRTQSPQVLFTPNPEQLVLARKNPHFQRLLQQADVLIPDGIGLVWASRWLKLFGRGEAISERIAGIDLAVDLLEWAKKERWRVLLLGGKGYHQAGGRRVELIANGNSTGKLRLQWLMGYENVSRPTKSEETMVVATLTKLKPQLVLVAFGAPQQERWVIEHFNLLKKSRAKIVMVVGGSFDTLFGKLKRAPWWLRGLGLEWLYRLVQEPARWRRQLALLKFIGLTLREPLRK